MRTSPSPRSSSSTAGARLQLTDEQKSIIVYVFVAVGVVLGATAIALNYLDKQTVDVITGNGNTTTGTSNPSSPEATVSVLLTFPPVPNLPITTVATGYTSINATTPDRAIPTFTTVGVSTAVTPISGGGEGPVGFGLTGGSSVYRIEGYTIYTLGAANLVQMALMTDTALTQPYIPSDGGQTIPIMFQANAVTPDTFSFSAVFVVEDAVSLYPALLSDPGDTTFTAQNWHISMTYLGVAKV